MKYDITLRTLAIIGLVTAICGIVACGNQIGDGGKDNSDNDNSNNINDFGDPSEEQTCENVEYLWKPDSDSDGNLVILFDRGIIFAEVCVEVLEDESLDCQSKYTITNGGRATYRFPKKGEEYTGLILTESCEFMVNEPAERQE